ncbi:hypothetical protein RND81_14G084400 [Saponaria officinalis]|uniref:Uncharacterized protein n=1 Tax=Saponaria officinalis TaxID=3572 RepID=A0AAW1GKN2_SAPOF
MGTQIHNQNVTQKIIIICNYILIGAASSCIFLTLSLRLVPTVVGLLLILLHAATIAGAVSVRWFAFHMVTTIFAVVFQGSVSVLIFASTGKFLGAVGSYVREEDGAVILRLSGGLCVLMFCLEFVVMWLAFLGRFHEGSLNESGGKNEELKNWPSQF